MLFAALFEDDPARLDVRREHMDAHLGYLDRCRRQILVGGSLRDEPDGDPEGGLWIIDAPNKAEARRLCEADPFWVHGLRRTVRIMHWSKAFADRTVAI